MCTKSGNKQSMLSGGLYRALKDSVVPPTRANNESVFEAKFLQRREHSLRRNIQDGH